MRVHWVYVLTLNSKPENYNTATKFTMTEAKAVTSGGSTTCTIAQVVMEGPASKKRRRTEIEDEAWKGFIGSLDRDRDFY